jgi:hypothetical protein
MVGKAIMIMIMRIRTPAEDDHQAGGRQRS